MARLLNGGHLSDHVLHFCIAGAIIAGLIPIITLWKPAINKFLPSATAIAIAFYITPNFSIPRILGAFIQFIWVKKFPQSHMKYMIIIASGFVLGEGVTSIVLAIMKSAGMPIISCFGCST